MLGLCRYWSQVNPHWLTEIDHQHKWKINVWCGIIGSRIIDSIFFQETLNADRYSALIETDLPVLLETLPLRLRLVPACGSNKIDVRRIHQELPVQY